MKIKISSRLPALLICSRIIIGFVLIWLSCLHVNKYSTIAITLLSIGLLTDILDGIIARQLNISTQRLRRMDSAADQVFYLSVAVATYIQCPSFFKNHIPTLSVLLATEAIMYIISFIKFRKEIATHTIGAKIWSLFLFASLVQVMAGCHSDIIWPICFWIGMITRAEIIAIILILKKWTNDVPSVYHAVKLRQGKAISRNKLFNG